MGSIYRSGGGWYGGGGSIYSGSSSGGGWYGSGAPTPRKKRDSGFSLGGFLSNVLGEAADIGRGFPGAVYQVGKAGFHDVGGLLASPLPDPIERLIPGLGDPGSPLTAPVRVARSSRVVEDVVKPQASYYRERYVRPFEEKGLAGAGDVGRSFYEQPVSGALDVFALASGGTGAASRAGLLGKPGPRMVQAGRAEVQFGRSPNRLTNLAEDLFDRYSMKHPGAPVFGGERRVARQGARNIRLEQARVRGTAAGDIHAIQRISFQPIENVRLRRRLFYEAQLPEEMRGGAGLQTIRQDFQTALDAERAAAAPRADVVNRLSRQIRKVDRALEAKPSKRYEAALESVRELTRQREEIMVEAFGPEILPVLEQRRGLLAERYGADDLEGAMFVGHRARQAPRSIQRMGRTWLGGAPADKSRLGATRKNELRLWRQGRVRPDPDVVVEDWSIAQTYAFHVRVKQFLHQLGRPVDPDVGPSTPDAYLVRLDGKVPDHWKDARHLDDPDSLIQSLEGYVKSYLAPVRSSEGQAMLAAKGGNIVEVDNAVVHKFFSHYAGAQGTAGGLEGVGTAFDIGNGLVKTSLLYANPGYIPSNFVGNLVYAGLDQHIFLPQNLFRAGKAILHDRELTRLLRAEVGTGPTSAIAGEMRPGRARTVGQAVVQGERRFAGFVSKIPDVAPRMAAWFYHARKAGFRTRQRQMQLLTDPKLVMERNQVHFRVQEAMVNFDTLAPWEKLTISKVFFVWPWIRGATRWAARFPKDKPVRASVLGQQALEARERQQEALGDLPSWAQQMIPLGGSRVINPASVDPMSTTLGLVEKLFYEGEQSPYEMVNPGIAAAFNIMQGKSEYGENVGFGGAVGEEGSNLLPLLKLIREYRNPPDSDVYPGQDSTDILLRRLLRFMPYDVNVSELNRRAREEHGQPARRRRKSSGSIYGGSSGSWYQ